MTDDEIVTSLQAIPAAEVARRAVLVYRCPRGCTLLCVFVVGGRRFGYKPAVKLSDNPNKALGPVEEVERYQRVFGANGMAKHPVLV